MTLLALPPPRPLSWMVDQRAADVGAEREPGPGERDRRRDVGRAEIGRHRATVCAPRGDAEEKKSAHCAGPEAWRR